VTAIFAEQALLPEGWQGNVRIALDGGHIAIHSVPEHHILLFDVVAPASHDFRIAVEVFSRRLTARDVKSDTRGRG